MTKNSSGNSEENRNQARNLAGSIGNAVLFEESIFETGQLLLFLIRRGTERFLCVTGPGEEISRAGFEGEQHTAGGSELTICSLSHSNAVALRKQVSWTVPVLIGTENSYGFGDRLGNAGPAHLRSVEKTKFRPILAQQSIRELERTRRTPGEVLDAASWAVFERGYREGFGADADHLKTPDHIDLMVEAGYTMFTIDPGEYVHDGAAEAADNSLEKLARQLPWQELEDDLDSFLERYDGRDIDLDGNLLTPGRREVLEGAVKYGRVISHTKLMCRHLESNWPGYPAEIELSVDETDSPTTPFEHYLIASELDRLGIRPVSLAPRFCGDFEKGIDFRGDLEQFRHEYGLHLAIAARFGGYKLSIHSGSDKFSVYEVIGSMDRGAVHVKTAGTSYLEAIRTVAQADPALFREILDFSRSRFDADRKSYHISDRLSAVPEAVELKDDGLAALLDDDDARQVLHVTYGSVLSGELPAAKGFKERLMRTLENHPELYEANLIRHFEKHLKPFEPLMR